MQYLLVSKQTELALTDALIVLEESANKGLRPELLLDKETGLYTLEVYEAVESNAFIGKVCRKATLDYNNRDAVKKGLLEWWRGM